MVNHDELESWIKTRPREDAILIALRAALRVFPFWASQMGEAWARKGDFSCSLLLRCSLTSGVARSYSDAKFRAAASQSADAHAAAAYAARAAAAVVADAVSADAARAATYAARASASHSANSLLAASAADAVEVATACLPIWRYVEEDVACLDNGEELLNSSIWYGDKPERIRTIEATALQNLTRETGDPNSFWHRWWRGAVSGQWLDWNLQREVALIPDDIWQQGPKAVMVAIAEIEARYAPAQQPDLETTLRALPPASPERKIAFTKAVTEHRETIPPTLEALLEFCGREINRLQFRNAPYDGPEHEADIQHQIRTLTSIHVTLTRLKALLPPEGELSAGKLEEAEKLSRLYLRHLKEWPRKAAEDIVDSTYRFAIVGTSAILAPMLGLDSNTVILAGTALVGGKKVADAFAASKNAGDLSGPQA